MAAKDLYEILGVARDAHRDGIRKAYRKLARQNHPDLNPGDQAAEERFRDISKAWEAFEDAEKRRNYEEFGEVSLEAGFDPNKARQGRPGGVQRSLRVRGLARSGRPLGGVPLRRARRPARELLGGSLEGRGIRLRGADLEARLEIEFLEAVRGGEKRLTVGRATPSSGTPTRRPQPRPAATRRRAA